MIFFRFVLLFCFQIRASMSSTLANMTMDDVKTVRETANSVAKLAAIPDECAVEAQVPNVNSRLVLPAIIL